MLVRALQVGFVRMTAAGLSFVSALLIARALGLTDFGMYSILTSVVIVLCAFSKWGWDSSAIRYIAQYLSGGKPDLAGAYARYGLRAVLLLALLVSGAFLLLGYVRTSVLGFSPFLDASTAPLMVLVAVPLLCASCFAQGVLRGQRKPVVAELFESLLKPVTIVVGVFAGLALFADLAAWQIAGGAYVVASLIAAGGGYFAARHGFRTAPRAVVDARVRREWWISTGFHGIVNLAQTATSRTPVLVAGFLLSPGDAALMAVAARLAELLQFGLVAIALGIAPQIASLFHGNEIAALRAVAKRAQLLSLAFAVAGMVVLAIAGKFILGWFGHEFERAYQIVLVMAAGQTLAAAFGPVGPLVTMTGNQRSAAVLLVCSCAAGVAMAFLFGRIHGVVGVAAAAALSTLMYSVSLWSVCRRILR